MTLGQAMLMYNLVNWVYGGYNHNITKPYSEVFFLSLGDLSMILDDLFSPVQAERMDLCATEGSRC